LARRGDAAEPVGGSALNDDNFLNLFGEDTEIRAMVPGEVLFRTGDKPDALYIIKSGQLQIYDEGVVFETVGPGGIIGEMALVDGSPRSASAKAVSAAEVIPVDEKRFMWMVEQTPFFALKVMRVLTQRLRITDNRLRAMIK
jgi:CRP-like cAMP-binding protein